jgi:hypothetical protein
MLGTGVVMATAAAAAVVVVLEATLTSKHLVFPQPAEAEVRPQPW